MSGTFSQDALEDTYCDSEAVFAGHACAQFPCTGSDGILADKLQSSSKRTGVETACRQCRRCNPEPVEATGPEGLVAGKRDDDGGLARTQC